MLHRPHLRRNGVTLLELLIALGILGALIAVLLPAIQAARASARSLQCKNNIRQVALATISFYDSKKRLPIAGALVDVLPDLDQVPLYNAMQPGGIAYARTTEEELRMPSVLLCPERRPLDNYSLYVNYCMNDGGTTVPRSGLFGGDRYGRLVDASPDGLSNTMMFSERLDAPFDHPILPGGDPASGVPAVPYGMTPPTSHHHAGVHGARCDGSVQFVPNSINVSVWRALGTINYGDSVEE